MKIRRAAICAVTALLAGGLAAVSAPQAQAAGPNAVVDLAGCRTNTLAANDDGSTGLVDIGFTLNLNGVDYDRLYVNNNGNVSFQQPFSTYTPYDFTSSGDILFSPFFADVDTRGAGSGLVTYGQTTYADQAAFCVDWVDVGYFSNHVDKLNSFQLLIVDRDNGDFDLIYNYDKIQWETGDASSGTGGLGGTSAAAGWSTGDGVPETNVMLGGSFIHGGFLDGGPYALINHVGTDGQVGRIITPFRASQATGGLVRGTLDADGDSPSGVTVQACSPAAGCRVSYTDDLGAFRFASLPPGTYTVTARSGAGYEGGSKTVTVAGGGVYDLVIDMGAPISELPSDWTAGDASGGEVPVVWTDQPTPVATGPMCDGAGTWEVRANGLVLASGVLTKAAAPNDPGMVVYSATVPPLTANVGIARVFVVIDCLNDRPQARSQQVEAPPLEFDFSLQVVPAVRLLTASGAPAAGATATLLRSSTANGVFAPVPDGSPLLSEFTDENPVSGPADGKVGWDVAAGFYKVTASSGGCTVTSPAVQLPDQALSFDLTVACATPTPTPTVTPTPAPDPACATKQSAYEALVAKLGQAQVAETGAKAKQAKAAKKVKKAKKALKKAKQADDAAKMKKAAKKAKKAKKALKKAKKTAKAAAATVKTVAAQVAAAKAGLC